MATGYELVQIGIGTSTSDPSLRIIIIFYNLRSIRFVLLHLFFGPLTNQYMARPWESALHFKPITLPHSSSNMSNRLCSKGSSGTSFVCCSVPASLSASGRGPWLLLRFVHSCLLLLYRFFFSALFLFPLFFFSLRLFSLTGVTFTGFHWLFCWLILCCSGISWLLLLRHNNCLLIGCDWWLILLSCLSGFLRVLCGFFSRSLLITYCDGLCSSLGLVLLTVLLILFKF